MFVLVVAALAISESLTHAHLIGRLEANTSWAMAEREVKGDSGHSHTVGVLILYRP